MTPRAKVGLAQLKALHQAAQQAREAARQEAIRQEAVRKEAARKEAARKEALGHATARYPVTSGQVADPADAQLFQRAMQAVTPLKHLASARARVVPNQPSAEQLAQQRARRQHAQGQPDPPAAAPLSDHYEPILPTAIDLAWHAPEWAADTPRRLQRGQWPVTARLDLHGLRVDAARAALLAFLEDCVAHRVRCVRIIHGQGYGSAGGAPVLREKTPAWLMQHPAVCAFVQAPAAEGGAGALLALLRVAHEVGA